MTICIDDNYYFELKINRKPIKYAYIRVRHNNVLEISAPVKMPYDLIAELIKEKKQWILNVSRTLEDDFGHEDIKLMPVSENQSEEAKFDAEDAAYDSVERMYPLVKKFNVQKPEVRVRYMTSRWGSCILNKRRIWINAYLVKLPESCLDYVVLHELIHFIHPNHSKEFYGMLSQLMPDWKSRRDILRHVHLPPKDAVKKASRI